MRVAEIIDSYRSWQNRTGDKTMKHASICLLVFAALILLACSDREPAEITARHILIMYQGSTRAPETVQRTKEQAQEQAAELLDQVEAGADFAALATQHSDCPSKARGGLLSPFGRGVMAAPFEEAAFALKKGEISGVVETEFGFHIIKREK
ncbi:peptidylprolyl isomerase [candidate division KSB1 bacterium]|nr:peptidylprolyl isomerase [candidate division KSB1 bacterium]